jgi:hypothetical protein
MLEDLLNALVTLHIEAEFVISKDYEDAYDSFANSASTSKNAVK